MTWANTEPNKIEIKPEVKSDDEAPEEEV